MQKMLAVMCGLVLVTGAWAEETLEQIEKKLNAAHEKLDAYSSDMQTIQNMTFPQGSMKTDIKGKMEWLRKGDKIMFRMEQKGQSAQNFGGQEMKQDVDTLMISDGEFMYTVNKMMGQTQAMKMKADPKMSGETTKMFEALKTQGEVTVLPSEKFDGADCYCVQVVMAANPGNPMSKQKIWFRKDIGMMSKWVAFNDKDETVMTTTNTNIKVGAKIDEARFVFTAPEGVQVQDLSAMQP